jgi:hypothetical protein
MNTFVEIVLEAERESVKELMGRMREEALRAAMRAAAQASLAQKTALRQEPGRQGSGRQEPGRQEPGRQNSEPRVADSGRVVRVGGDFVYNNSGRPDVTMVGRARPTKPIQSVKSKIVPEPDQIQSARPVRPAPPHRT